MHKVYCNTVGCSGLIIKEGGELCPVCDSFKSRIEILEQACWEAYQFIGASTMDEQPEQDAVDMMDKLCAAMGVEKGEG